MMDVVYFPSTSICTTRTKDYDCIIVMMDMVDFLSTFITDRARDSMEKYETLGSYGGEDDYVGTGAGFLLVIPFFLLAAISPLLYILLSPPHKVRDIRGRAANHHKPGPKLGVPLPTSK